MTAETSVLCERRVDAVDGDASCGCSGGSVYVPLDRRLTERAEIAHGRRHGAPAADSAADRTARSRRRSTLRRRYQAGDGRRDAGLRVTAVAAGAPRHRAIDRRRQRRTRRRSRTTRWPGRRASRRRWCGATSGPRSSGDGTKRPRRSETAPARGREETAVDQRQRRAEERVGRSLGEIADEQPARMPPTACSVTLGSRRRRDHRPRRRYRRRPSHPGRRSVPSHR